MVDKVKMLKDWGWNKAGDVVEIFSPMARQWVFDGIAEYVKADRSDQPVVEAAVAPTASVENATEQNRGKRR
jgi:hypothetical protein